MQVQFYADVIDVITGWLDRSLGSTWTSRHIAFLPFTASTADHAVDTRLMGLLQAYGYLIAAISYIGAEQALCSVFHSFVCFSHRETFYYTNFSFAGEAVFRLYRHSYPVGAAERRRPAGWRTDEHRVFFPELTDCRREIIADLDYIGMSTDPSLCSAVRKNETRFHELDQLTVDEVERLVVDVRRRLDSAVDASRLRYIISGVVAAAAIVYVTIATLTHCLAQSRCASSSQHSNRKRKHSKEQLETSNIYTERPVEQTATAAAAAADNSWHGNSWHGNDVEQVLSELTPSRTALTDNLANDVSFIPAVDCKHRRQLSPPPPPSFPALRVACV